MMNTKRAHYSSSTWCGGLGMPNARFQLINGIISNRWLTAAARLQRFVRDNFFPFNWNYAITENRRTQKMSSVAHCEQAFVWFFVYIHFLFSHVSRAFFPAAAGCFFYQMIYIIIYLACFTFCSSSIFLVIFFSCHPFLAFNLYLLTLFENIK